LGSIDKYLERGGLHLGEKPRNGGSRENKKVKPISPNVEEGSSVALNKTELPSCLSNCNNLSQIENNP
jgi:hypothetical protein